MAKFLIEASVENYIRYVAECADAEEARARGRIDFYEGVLPSLSGNDVVVVVSQVDDDEPEGDRG